MCPCMVMQLCARVWENLNTRIMAVLKLSIVLVVPTFIRSSSDADSFAY